MSKQEFINRELTEIIKPLRFHRVLHPEDEAEVLQRVRVAAGGLAYVAEKEDEEAFADATTLAKTGLYRFVERMALESELGSREEPRQIERDIFRGAQVEFLPCPPFCKPRP